MLKTKRKLIIQCTVFTAFVLLLLLGDIAVLKAQNFPNRPSPPRLVNDFANILSASEEKKLERKLKIYDDSTSTQITVVTIKNLEGSNPNLYASELGEKWGVGQKGSDNGMIILVVPNQRKTAIQVGYGLEEFIPDAYAKQIIDEYMLPSFKKGQWYNGLNQATNVVYGLLSGHFKAFKSKNTSVPWSLVIALLVFFVALVIIFSRTSQMAQTISDEGVDTYPENHPNRKTKKYRPKRSVGRRGRSQWGGWIGAGGSFGSGSAGGGGFGGFGGGSFGGGGASGSW